MLAAGHLALFSLIHNVRAGSLPEKIWWALAFGGFVLFLHRIRAESRAGTGGSGFAGAVAWGTASALELHASWGALSASHIVPVIIFPSIGYFLSPVRSASYAAVAGSWLLLVQRHDAFTPGWTVFTVVTAVLGVVAGQAVRIKVAKSGSGTEDVRKAIEQSRSLFFPWENPPGDRPGKPDGDPLETLENRGILRWRADLEDGIRRILEGIIPITGADGVLYVTPQSSPGRPFVPGLSAWSGGRNIAADVLIPDSFVPLREAIVFRRAYIAEGDEGGAVELNVGGEKARPSCLATVPVVVGGNVAGAILAVRFGEERWTEPVLPALEMGAYFIAGEQERGRRWYQASLYLARQEVFHRMVRDIAEIAERSDPSDLDKMSPRTAVYRAVTRQIRKALELDRILLVETGEEMSRGRIAWEESGDISGEREDRSDLGGTYLEWVVRNGVHRIFPGNRKSGGKYPVLPADWTDRDDRSYLLVPVRGAGGFRGAIACAARPDRNFHGGDAEAVADAFTIMRMGISHALHVEKLGDRATRDGLTELYNQRTFREKLTATLSKLDERYPCAVVMVDIDHFKKVNDTYGHPAGDEVLRKIAGVIRKTIRRGDMAGRYGGEEFVIYLHMAEREQAMQGAERLRMMIRQTRFFFKGKEFSVTASMGIACYHVHGKSCEELLKNADDALYRSKTGGRDRVTVY